MNYDDEYEREVEEMAILLRERFWARIRSGLYKQICKGKGGFYQWSYITGIKSKDSKGNKIRLSKDNIGILEKTVDYLNSTEGRDELMQIGLLNSPENIDELIENIQRSKTKDEVKKEEFRAFLKYKDKILSYLTKFL